MRKLAIVLILAALWMACGGGKDRFTTDTPQGTAKIWIDAAIANDEARMRELTADEAEASCINASRQIREHGFTTDKVMWSTEPPEGSVYTWAAANGPAIVWVKLREVGENQYEVFEISTSW